MNQPLNSLFDLRYGHSLELNRLERAQSPDGVNFVSRAMGNNGVTARVTSPVRDDELGQPGELTVALSGNGVLSTFVQPSAFVCGFHVMILKPLDPHMSTVERLWWARCIWENRYLYSYGRQANRTLATLPLPSSVPDWVSSLSVPSIAGLTASSEPRITLTPTERWQDFELQELFEIHKGRRLTKADRKPGTLRFVGASEKNNGVTDHVAGEAQFPAGTLTVAYNGNSVGWAFYQDEPYLASDDVNVLEPRQEVSRLALLFVAAIIKHGKSRYTYGYKWNRERMLTSVIKLPANDKGAPDWAYMDRYMRGLAFSGLVVRSGE